MIIDSHTHLGKKRNHFYREEELLASMKENKIDYAVVVSITLDEFTTDEEKEAIETAKKHKELLALGNITEPALVNKKVIDNLENHLKEKTIRGVKIFLGYKPFWPYDERLYPIYELCQKYDFPVIFHTGYTYSLIKGAKLRYSHPLNIDDVASDFPNLKIILAHMGNPWLIDCAAVLYKNKNVYADLSAFFSEFTVPFPESEKVDFRFYLKELRKILGSLGKLLFGTDWPIYPHSEYLRAANWALESLNITAKEKELIFFKNAVNLFRINL